MSDRSSKSRITRNRNEVRARGECPPWFLTLCLVSAVGVVGGCRIGAPSYRPLYAEPSPEIAIRAFPSSAAAGNYAGNTDFGRLFAEYLAGALQERGVRALLIDSSAADVSRGAYVSEGEITRLDAGSWSLRFWVGFGAGRAGLGARVTVRRTADRRKVFDETLETHSATWQGQEDILRRCAASLAKRFAARIIRDMRAIERETHG
jgi:hypothetical protein